MKSKETIRRDKDLPHIIHIRELLRCRCALKAKTNKTRKKTKMIALLDYGSGNLRSVHKALLKAGADVRIVQATG